MSAHDIAMIRLRDEMNRLHKADESGNAVDALLRTGDNDMAELADKYLDRCERYVDLTRLNLEDIAANVRMQAADHSMSAKDCRKIQKLLREVYRYSALIKSKYLGNQGSSIQPEYMHAPLI